MGPNYTYKLLHNKGNYKKDKKTTSEWEKIIANETTDKGLIFKIDKKLIELNARKRKKPIKKCKRPKRPNLKGKRPKKTFLQRRHTDG